MSRQDYPYDEDEFDILGADRTPQGVHRAPVPRWRQLLPFAIVIVLAPLLAWAGVSALSGDFGSEPEDTPPAVTEPAEDDDGEEPADPDGTDEDPGAEDAPDGDEDPGETENGTEEPDDGATDDEADVDRNVPVLILNGTTTVGLAGSTAEALNADGWTNTSTADYGQAQPSVTTLYYHDALVAEEAEAVAAELGIAETVESASAASAGLVIVLRPDFQLP